MPELHTSSSSSAFTIAGREARMVEAGLTLAYLGKKADPQYLFIVSFLVEFPGQKTSRKKMGPQKYPHSVFASTHSLYSVPNQLLLSVYAN